MHCDESGLNKMLSTSKTPARLTCRICVSSSLMLHMLVNEETLDRCTECGFVQVRDEPSEETLRGIYSTTYFAHAKYRDRRALELEHQRRLMLLSKYVSSNASVLDAGCSVGDFITSAKTNYQMYGIDIAESAITQAQEYNPELRERLITGRLEDSVFANQRFDAICLWDVIEHLWDPSAVARDLLQRLKPGGYLFISTPAIDAPVAKVLGKYWAFMTPPEHLSFFSKNSFYELFDNQTEAHIVSFARKGKWANLAFIGYKLGRIAPTWVPKALFALFKLPIINRLNLYVPTGDVQYLVIQRQF